MFLPCPDPDPDPDSHKFADPDPGKKVWKWMNKSLFCRVGDVQCKQFHFFCSDFKHPLLRIIWNVKKTQKKFIFSLYPQPPPPDTPMKIFARIRIRIRKKKPCIYYTMGRQGGTYSLPFEDSMTDRLTYIRGDYWKVTLLNKREELCEPNCCNFLSVSTIDSFLQSLIHYYNN